MGESQIEIVSGWKDIANYLRKGVRTVQRYERELQLPIHRPAGRFKGSVIARKVDLDNWVTAGPTRNKSALIQSRRDLSRVLYEFRGSIAELARLRATNATSRKALARSRGTLKETLDSLVSNVQPKPKKVS